MRPTRLWRSCPLVRGGGWTTVLPTVRSLPSITSPGSDTRIEQLNPPEFKSTFKFGIPQVPPAASALILKAALCSVLGGQGRVLSCDRPNDENLTQVFQLDLARYCQTLRAGDVGQFCAPNPPPYSWVRMVHGSTVILLKSFGERRGVYDPYRMENDHGGYLK
jgi:hypothetical protein